MDNGHNKWVRAGTPWLHLQTCSLDSSLIWGVPQLYILESMGIAELVKNTKTALSEQ